MNIEEFIEYAGFGKENGVSLRRESVDQVNTIMRTYAEDPHTFRRRETYIIKGEGFAFGFCDFGGGGQPVAYYIDDTAEMQEVLEKYYKLLPHRKPV